MLTVLLEFFSQGDVSHARWHAANRAGKQPCGYRTGATRVVLKCLLKWYIDVGGGIREVGIVVVEVLCTLGLGVRPGPDANHFTSEASMECTTLCFRSPN